jgi:hypothetical protein
VDVVNNELKKKWKEAATHLRYYPHICLEEMKKTTRNISQDIRRAGRYSYRAPSVRKSYALPIEQTCSVKDSGLGFVSDVCRDDWEMNMSSQDELIVHRVKRQIFRQTGRLTYMIQQRMGEIGN